MSTKPFGLPNKGNSCFVNSILQCLYALSYSLSSDRSLETELPLDRALRWRKKFFGNAYSQEDAHEFLLYTLDKLHSRNKKKVVLKFASSSVPSAHLAWKQYAEREYSFVIGYFHGQYAVSHTCCSCRHVSTSYEPFMGVELAVPQRHPTDLTVQHLLKDYSRPETISGYTCARPKCKNRQGSVIQKRKMNRYPQCLVVTLKRFVYTSNGRCRKNNTLVGISKRVQFYNRTYTLVGICNHYGSLEGGHYTADIRKNGKWYNCDDSAIDKYHSSNDIPIQNAYILFYVQ